MRISLIIHGQDHRDTSAFKFVLERGTDAERVAARAIVSRHIERTHGMPALAAAIADDMIGIAAASHVETGAATARDLVSAGYSPEIAARFGPDPERYSGPHGLRERAAPHHDAGIAP